MRRFLVLVGCVGVAVTAAVGASSSLAGASPAPVRPGQIFNGFVNGQPAQATVHVACPPNHRPGTLGHPAPGQTVEAQRSVDQQPAGYTGAGHRISVDLHLQHPVPHVMHLAYLSAYGVNMPISTSILVPCNGEGDAVFSTVNGGPTAQSLTVHVMLVSPSTGG